MSERDRRTKPLSMLGIPAETRRLQVHVLTFHDLHEGASLQRVTFASRCTAGGMG